MKIHYFQRYHEKENVPQQIQCYCYHVYTLTHQIILWRISYDNMLF